VGLSSTSDNSPNERLFQPHDTSCLSLLSVLSTAVAATMMLRVRWEQGERVKPWTPAEVEQCLNANRGAIGSSRLVIRVDCFRTVRSMHCESLLVQKSNQCASHKSVQQRHVTTTRSAAASSSLSHTANYV
jgi:hypothetical protein